MYTIYFIIMICKYVLKISFCSLHLHRANRCAGLWANELGSGENSPFIRKITPTCGKLEALFGVGARATALLERKTPTGEGAGVTKKKKLNKIKHPGTDGFSQERE